MTVLYMPISFTQALLYRVSILRNKFRFSDSCTFLKDQSEIETIALQNALRI